MYVPFGILDRGFPYRMRLDYSTIPSIICTYGLLLQFRPALPKTSRWKIDSKFLLQRSSIWIGLY